MFKPIPNYQQIASILENLEIKLETNYSLHYGKTGLAIAYYLFYTATGHKHLKDKAQITIDDLAYNIGYINDLSFENGLPGIGWGIEWMVQNSFIDANTDDILEELDDTIYKRIVYGVENDESELDQQLGNLFYFYRRKLAVNPGTLRFRRLCIQECISMCIGKLCEQINEKLNNEMEFNLAGMRQIATTIILLSRFIDKNFEIFEGSKLLCRLLDYTLNHLKSDVESGEQNVISIYAIAKAGVFLKDPFIMQNIPNLLKSLNNQSFPKNEIESSFLKNSVASIFNYGFTNIDVIRKFNNQSIFDVLILITSVAPDKVGHWEEGWFL